MRAVVVVVAVAAGLALAPAVPALGSAQNSHDPVDLGGVPAVSLLGHGRVLVLRPNRLEVVLDGRLVRAVVVRQPVDLGQLPSLVRDPAYAAPLREQARRATGAGTGPGIRLGAVLAQRPGTAITAAGLHLRLADTGGAGPARLIGTRARLTLRHARIDAEALVPAPAPVAAGLRYLHGSNLSLDDVTLAGLGVRGTPAVPAVRADGGSALALKHLSLTTGGPGVELRDPAWLIVEGLHGQRVGGALLTVSGGSGAHIRDVSSGGCSGAALRLRGTAGTMVEGLTSIGDAAALVAQDVDAVQAGRIRARGDGVVLGGRSIELTDVDVDAAVDAVRVAGGAGVVVRGGFLGGRPAAVDADPTGRVVLQGVRTTGALRGPVRATAGVQDGDGAARDVSWWDRPVRGAGAVAVVVVAAGIFLEALRGRRRSRVDGSGNPDRERAAGGRDASADGAINDDLALDLGEWRVH